MSGAARAAGELVVRDRRDLQQRGAAGGDRSGRGERERVPLRAADSSLERRGRHLAPCLGGGAHVAGGMAAADAQSQRLAGVSRRRPDDAGRKAGKGRTDRLRCAAFERDVQLAVALREALAIERDRAGVVGPREPRGRRRQASAAAWRSSRGTGCRASGARDRPPESMPCTTRAEDAPRARRA